ncbi:snRNA-activating protein complex subunit 1-like [Cololabis saira]|uniref:snRNA-activating protein complex subunit 1-like n=1 Tax=Cololabis saira TaxID=129043 RepID=UPI002AD4AA28|nr:snRNA-activating protein complex subunit 1-like [Cololabis saira]
MPNAPPNYTELFQEPLTEDVELLLARFQRMDSIRYEDFSALWRDMRFSDLFVGFVNPKEQKMFSRIALATALKYFLPPYNYQIRVGGLYLMFGFYHAQQAEPPLKIRLALGDWDYVQKFLRDSVEAGHHDVVYICRRLLATKAVHFTAMLHFLTFHKLQKPKQQQPVCSSFLSRATAVHDLMCADLLDELTNIQSHYEKAKAATEGVISQADMIKKDLASCLSDSMTEFITWQEKTFMSPTRREKKAEEEEEDNEDPCGNRARLLSSLKQKSFSTFQEASKSRRHVQPEREDDSVLVPDTSQGRRRRKRAPSLRTRTWENLGLTQDNKKSKKTWLLSVPEHPKGRKGIYQPSTT